jgi:hypothetical protein
MRSWGGARLGWPAQGTPTALADFGRAPPSCEWGFALCLYRGEFVHHHHLIVQVRQHAPPHTAADVESSGALAGATGSNQIVRVNSLRCRGGTKRAPASRGRKALRQAKCKVGERGASKQTKTTQQQHKTRAGHRRSQRMVGWWDSSRTLSKVLDLRGRERYGTVGRWRARAGGARHPNPHADPQTPRARAVIESAAEGRAEGKLSLSPSAPPS